MKKNIKKIFAVCLSASMVFPLAACGAGDSESTSANSERGGSSEKDPFGKYDEKITISLGRYASASSLSNFKEGDDFENNPYTRYVEKKLNVDLVDDFEAADEAYKNQMALSIASGELPDIVSVKDYDTLVQMVDNDLVYDMTDLYEEYASDYIKGLYDSYDGRALDMATFEGKLMALPGTNADNGVPILCWMRKDWLDKLGMNPDPDGDLCIITKDIEDVARAFIDEKPSGKDTIGLAFQEDSAEAVQCIAEAQNALMDKWVQNKDGSIDWSTFSDESKNTWELLSKWYKEGLIDSQFGTRTWDDMLSLMINNQLGITFGAWHMPDWRFTNIKSKNPEAEFIAYTVADDNGRVNTYHENSADRYIVVNKNCEHPEAAVKILNVLYDEIARAPKEDMPEIAGYIENGGANDARPYYIELLDHETPALYYKEHKAVIDGTMKPEECTIAENRGSAKAVLEYLKDPEHVTGDTIGGWHFYESRIQGLGASVEALNKNNNADWTTPMYPPTLPAMEQKKATIDKLELETYIKIVTGEKSIDDFKEFEKEWRKLGGDEIIAELEEYFAEK